MIKIKPAQSVDQEIIELIINACVDLFERNDYEFDLAYIYIVDSQIHTRSREKLKEM